MRDAVSDGLPPGGHLFQDPQGRAEPGPLPHPDEAGGRYGSELGEDDGDCEAVLA